MLLFVPEAGALDQVSLQLKWKHQFQFAGYYAALERGFYREHGLEVEIRDGGPGVDAGTEVAYRAADFGVCTTSVLTDRLQRDNNVVLGVIFQHSAAIVMVPYRAGIHSIAELKGRRLMDTPGSDDIAAMLKREGLDYERDLSRVNHSGDPRDLLHGKADAMIAYSTNEPYLFEDYDTPYLFFAPAAYGIDFYGDNLCTSRKLLAEHPRRVRAFRAASLKGWAYALSHEEEIVDLIRSKYSVEKSRNALLFEAARTKQLVRPRHTPIGDQSEQRWKAIAKTYVGLGMLGEDKLPEGLIYMPDDDGWRARLRAPWLWMFAGTVVGIILGWVIYRWSSRAFAGLRLSVVMSGLFVVVSIPVLIFILLFNFHQNEAAIRARLSDDVAKTKRASVEDAENLILPVAGTLEQLAAVAAENPEVFKQEESRDLLYRSLTSAPQIDAAYVSFENGFHRAVTRIDDYRRRSNQNIPISANWQSSYIETFPGKMRRVRHDAFFDSWPNFAGKYDVDTYLDIRISGLCGVTNSRRMSGR
jgi:ABC-type nitrate/sulfonate/bicarbonate transport system substrate-binding protein